MQNTPNEQRISAASVVAGKTRAEIIAAHEEFQALSYPARGADGERDAYEYFYAEKLLQSVDEIDRLESNWIRRNIDVEFPNDGVMVPVATARALVSNTRLTISDMSGASHYGYAYAVTLRGNDTQLIKSVGVATNGGWAEQFSLSQLEAVIVAVAKIESQIPQFKAK